MIKCVRKSSQCHKEWPATQVGEFRWKKVKHNILTGFEMSIGFITREIKEGLTPTSQLKHRICYKKQLMRNLENKECLLK